MLFSPKILVLYMHVNVPFASTYNSIMLLLTVIFINVFGTIFPNSSTNFPVINIFVSIVVFSIESIISFVFIFLVLNDVSLLDELYVLFPI